MIFTLFHNYNHLQVKPNGLAPTTNTELSSSSPCFTDIEQSRKGPLSSLSDLTNPTMAPRSFDLLQNTINLSSRSQSEADGELAWLRKRLENEHHELRSRSVQVGKENTPRHLTSPGTRLHEVCSALDMHVPRAVRPGRVRSRLYRERARPENVAHFPNIDFASNAVKKNKSERA